MTTQTELWVGKGRGHILPSWGRFLLCPWHYVLCNKNHLPLPTTILSSRQSCKEDPAPYGFCKGHAIKCTYLPYCNNLETVANKKHFKVTLTFAMIHISKVNFQNCDHSKARGYLPVSSPFLFDSKSTRLYVSKVNFS